MNKLDSLLFESRTTDNKISSIMFKYWLQGFFEIAEPKKINAKQLNTIRQHIKLTSDAESDSFVMKLSGIFLDRMEISESLTSKIKKELQSQFKKVKKKDLLSQNILNSYPNQISPKIIC